MTRRLTPPPNLQALVAKYGGYDKITPEIWIKYDRALANWRERVRWRGLDGEDEIER